MDPATGLGLILICIGVFVGGLVVAAASAVAMWSFGFAAWLWSRSVCRMHAPSVARSGEFPTSYEDRFARDLGRVAGLLPPALFVLLCGDTLHDAVMGGEREVAAWLAGFIVLAVAGGFGFVFFPAGKSTGSKNSGCKSYCYHFPAERSAGSFKQIDLRFHDF